MFFKQVSTVGLNKVVIAANIPRINKLKTSPSTNTLSVTDLINRIVQVLKRDLYWVRISTQNMELIKPVKP